MPDVLPRPALEALTDALWEERRCAEDLLRRLVVVGLLAEGDGHRFLSLALDEVEDAARAHAAARSRRRARVVETLGHGAALAAWVDRLPPGHALVLRDHLTTLRTVADEVVAAWRRARDAVDHASARVPADPDDQTLAASVHAFARDTLARRLPRLVVGLPVARERAPSDRRSAHWS